MDDDRDYTLARIPMLFAYILAACVFIALADLLVYLWITWGHTASSLP